MSILRRKSMARVGVACMVGSFVVSSCRFGYELNPSKPEPLSLGGDSMGGGAGAPATGGGTGETLTTGGTQATGGGAGEPGSGGASSGGAGEPGSGGASSGGLGGAAPTCNDGVENGEETDVDCGGTACPGCSSGRICAGDDDCESLICEEGVCATASCIDGVLNQGELAVDCGGPNCPCCSPGAFAAPEKLSGFNLAGSLYGPSLARDALTLYVAVFDADEDIFVATRPDRGAVFSAATPLGINSASLDGTANESASGLSLYFYSERSGTLGGRDLMVATRASRDSDFEVPAFLTSANSSDVDQSPSLSDDELRMVFASLRPGGAGSSDLWFAERGARADEFSVPVNLSELNTSFTESGPSLTSDELSLFFVSNRPDSQGHDIWVATRESRSLPFDAPSIVAEVSSAGEELDAFISADGRELLFSSNVDGQHELWRSLRDCQ